jgi:hypothetical protein
VSRCNVAFFVAATLALAGCGGSSHFADKSRPATPIDLSVYVNDHSVSVSPASVGAGPVVFLVTNSAATTELVSIRADGSGRRTAATTGPINPGTSAQVQADLGTGSYVVTTSAPGGQSARAIRPARLKIGAPRPNSNNAVLQP